MKRTLGLTVCAVVAVFAGNPQRGAAQADAAVRLFTTPSRNIVCSMGWGNGVGGEPDAVQCWVFSTRTRTHHAGAWLLFPTGRVIFSRPPVDPLPARFVLAYGSTLQGGPFRCHSMTSGLRCWSVRSGHGFFLSRESQRTF